MESAKELRARIVKLDTEIEQQRKLLTNLERDKKLAQRQLNAVLDPVARLPPEISSEIFFLSRTAFPEPGAMHIPMLLLEVCNAWSDIALSTPALWAAIGITFPCARGLKELLPIWLERARNQPLSVSLSGGGFDQEVSSIIWNHGQQLRHLEMCDVDGDEETDGDSWALVGRTKTKPLPSLETLTFRGLEDGGGWVISLSRVVELLRLAPNLVECVFSHADIWIDLGAGERLVLPNLRRMAFGELGTCPGFGDHVLDYLSLPGLETLSTSNVNTSSPDELFSFLERSSPPLLELILETDLNFVSLAECFRLINDLRRLEMWSECEAIEELFAALTQSPSLLPHLSTLVIHLNMAISETFWKALFHALSARSTHLRVFHLMVPKKLPASKMPAPDIITGFRGLGEDGFGVGFPPFVFHESVRLVRFNGMQVRISAEFETWDHIFQ